MPDLKSDPAAPPDGVAIAQISPSVSRLLTVIDRLARIDGWIAGGALVALTLFILSGVGLRLLSKVFDNIPAGLSTSWEYSSYLLATVFTFGSAMALRAGHHIRVTLLLSHFSKNNARKLEVITAAVGMAVSAFVCYSLVHFTWLSLLQGQKSMSSDTPLWIPKAVVSFGFFLLALQFTGRFISAFVGLPLEDRSMRPPVPIE